MKVHRITYKQIHNRTDVRLGLLRDTPFTVTPVTSRSSLRKVPDFLWYEPTEGAKLHEEDCIFWCPRVADMYWPIGSVRVNAIKGQVVNDPVGNRKHILIVNNEVDGST